MNSLLAPLETSAQVSDVMLIRNASLITEMSRPSRASSAVMESSKKAKIATAAVRPAVAIILAVMQRLANSRARLSAITRTKSAARINASSHLQVLFVDRAQALVIPRRSAQEAARHAPRTNTATMAQTVVITSSAHLVSVHREMSSAEQTIKIRHPPV